MPSPKTARCHCSPYPPRFVNGAHACASPTATRYARRRCSSRLPLLYVAFVVLGESIGQWWGWVLAWIGLVMCMMRIDAVHHEAIHRSLFARRWLNDVIASVTGALEGFHGPTYRCFHLAHHALTRRDHGQSDPEDFYDEVLTRPRSVGPVHIGARAGSRRWHVDRRVSRSQCSSWSAPLARCSAAHRPMWAQHHSNAMCDVGDSCPSRCGQAPSSSAVATGHTTELLQWWLVPDAVVPLRPVHLLRPAGALRRAAQRPDGQLHRLRSLDAVLPMADSRRQSAPRPSRVPDRLRGGASAMRTRNCAASLPFATADTSRSIERCGAIWPLVQSLTMRRRRGDEEGVGASKNGVAARFEPSPRGQG